MPRVYVTIEGEKEVIDYFKRLPEQGKKHLNDAAYEGAQYLQPKIVEAVPYDGSDSVHLKDNVKAKRGRRKRITVQSSTVEVGKRSADYAFHVEAGTRKMEGRKFMRKTADRYAEEVANIVTQKLFDLLGV